MKLLKALYYYFIFRKIDKLHDSCIFNLYLKENSDLTCSVLLGFLGMTAIFYHNRKVLQRRPLDLTFQTAYQTRILETRFCHTVTYSEQCTIHNIPVEIRRYKP